MKAICECLLWYLLEALPWLLFSAFMFLAGFAYCDHCRRGPADVIKEESLLLEIGQLQPYRFKDGGKGWSFQYPIPAGARWWEKRFFAPTEPDGITVAHWCLRDLDDTEWTPSKQYDGYDAAAEMLCRKDCAFIICEGMPKDKRFALVLLFRDSKP